MPGNQSTPNSSSSAQSYFTPRAGNLSFFHAMPEDALGDIFRFLSREDSLSLSTALSTTHEEDLRQLHFLARSNRTEFNKISKRISQAVADADFKQAEAILALFKGNQNALKALLTTQRTLTQKNGLPITGTVLEIAEKCWDSSSCEGGQAEMAEMLMRYMRMLPDGEQIIQTTFTKLFPNGHKTHQQDQENRATEFAKSILETLAKTLFDASAEDIAHVYALSRKEDAEVDDYINTHLSENKLWNALMVHHEAIKEFMIKDTVYNPLYLKKAFEIVARKDENEYEYEYWGNLSKGYDRLALLTIHGLGGIQACSPTLVGILFARAGIWDYDNMNESVRKQFKVDRDCKFKYGGGDVLARSVGGVLLVSKKFWACSGARGRSDFGSLAMARAFGIYMSDKNTALGSQYQSLFQCRQQGDNSCNYKGFFHS